MKKSTLKQWILMAVLWVAMPVSAYDFEVDGIYYNITSMAELEVGVTYNQLQYISGNSYRNTSYSGDIIIPETVNYNNRTFTVTSIEFSAFGTGHPESYGTYYDNHGCKITSINLPSTIRTIADYAFQNCQELSEVKLPTSLLSLGNQSFESSSIIKIVIPNSVQSIGAYCFTGCKSLENVIIGTNVSEVGSGAFSGNKKLLEVFCTGNTCAKGLTASSFSNAHSALEIYVPSVKAYGFGREYLTFPTRSFDYTGSTHNIEWTNNLKAYRCEIAESECTTEVNAGTHAKNLKATYSNGIDFSVEIPYEYTINKAPMALIVNDIQREYGEPNPAFSCNITGFVNGENEQTLGTTPTFECEATQKSNTGTYRILASLNAPNYEITYNYGTLSVLKAPITVAVANCARLYGDKNPQFDMTYTGLKNGETTPAWTTKPQFSTTANQQSDAGVYEVTANGGDSKNYDITSYVSGTLTVNKRELTVKANDCERLYGEENPQFGISYIGFVNLDSETSFVQKPVAECNATKMSNAGIYPIVVTGGEAKNYSFVYQDGSLKINPLTVGFKDVYNSVTYNDMSLSTNDYYFNYIPDITGPFGEDDFWIELWFLDKDNQYDQHITTISGGDYAGSYVNTNIDRPMCAGKYIFNLTSKGTNPNVVANPSRAYLTVNRASNNLEWNVDSPISVKVGEKVDLGITYQADLWCTFNTDYNEEILSLTSEGATGNNPHWYVTGLKEGETTLYFGIECRKNDMGFYDFTNSRTLSKRIKIEGYSGVTDVLNGEDSTSVIAKEGSIYILNKDVESVVRVYSMQGTMIRETSDDMVHNLPKGVYIVVVGSKSFKVVVR